MENKVAEHHVDGAPLIKKASDCKAAWKNKSRTEEQLDSGKLLSSNGCSESSKYLQGQDEKQCMIPGSASYEALGKPALSVGGSISHQW